MHEEIQQHTIVVEVELPIPSFTAAAGSAAAIADDNGVSHLIGIAHITRALPSRDMVNLGNLGPSE